MHVYNASPTFVGNERAAIASPNGGVAPLMTTTEAILTLRRDPEYADLIRDSYFDEDIFEAAERFRQSAEFIEAKTLMGPALNGGTVLDLGAGTGIASYSLARDGARLVYALEPDPSEVIGRGAIARLKRDLPVQILDCFGEEIPLADGAVDIVYARQVLHHSRDLNCNLSECARVLKPGGIFLGCREHVVDNQEQLETFLREHPVHRLAGGEHAFALQDYIRAIQSSGLMLIRTLGPFDSMINAFPVVRTDDGLRHVVREALRERFGALGAILHFVPGVDAVVRARLNRFPNPGRLYSFLAVKPAAR